MLVEHRWHTAHRDAQAVIRQLWHTYVLRHLVVFYPVTAPERPYVRYSCSCGKEWP